MIAVPPPSSSTPSRFTCQVTLSGPNNPASDMGGNVPAGAAVQALPAQVVALRQPLLGVVHAEVPLQHRFRRGQRSPDPARRPRVAVAHDIHALVGAERRLDPGHRVLYVDLWRPEV